MSKQSSDSPDHPQKIAADAFGGDALNPNDAMLARILASAKSGEPDEAVERWKAAFNAICPEPLTPDTQLLAKLASGEVENVDDLVSGAAVPQLPVAHRLAALKEKLV